MLVITRGVGEKIKIGGNVTLTVVAVNKGSQVRLGIEAPRTVVVDRLEVHERRQAEANATKDPLAQRDLEHISWR